MSLFKDYDVESIDTSFGIPDGTYERLVITSAEVRTSEKGNTGLDVTFYDDESDQSITKWNSLPTDNADQKTNDRNARFLKIFLTSLGIPVTRQKDVTPEDLIGIEVSAKVTTEQKNGYENKRIQVLSPARGSAVTENPAKTTSFADMDLPL